MNAKPYYAHSLEGRPVEEWQRLESAEVFKRQQGRQRHQNGVTVVFSVLSLEVLAA